jgi:hypothetical protein
MRQTIEGGNALWSKFLFLRIEDYKKVRSFIYADHFKIKSYLQPKKIEN